MWKRSWSVHLLTAMLWICITSWASAAADENACSTTHFTCANGRCISLAWKCDGDDDCHDNSDETNCTETTCEESYFKCKSDGKCIPEGWKCDEANDCADGSDETLPECNTCDNDEFQCPMNGTCIKRSWLCDGEDDCLDGADEKNCKKAICEDETDFQCKSSRECISAKWVCDSHEDCKDGSDEKDCSVHGECKEGSFRCTSNNACIKREWRCDKHQDCDDGSDEENCPAFFCGRYEFTCATGEKCIQDSWKCDGDNDCGDNSDELNCPPVNDSCRESEFQCKTLDRMCIHISWTCDGDDDCEDQSDEKQCNITCKSDQILCDTYCIHESLRCDGQVDCLNGSDEENCPATPVVKTCANDTFDCKGDGSECIAYKVICDGWADCSNGADERTKGGLCPHENPCNTDNGGCQHICYRKPEGAVCDCHRGFQFANGSTTECVDINECLIPGQCSQRCENTKGNYKCHCLPGYSLEKDGYCKATDGGEPELLLVDRKDLRRYHLLTKKYSLLIDNQEVEGAMAMDFHLAGHYVYWTDVTKEEIKRVNLKMNTIETVASQNVSTPDGLAVDWVHGHLYWTDTGLDHIEVSTLNGDMRSVLIQDGLDEPRAIALHPSKGLMFWTDWGYSPKIESAGMNGKSRKTIISEEIIWPNGLTIDYVDDRLYWIDAKTHQIGSSDLDGLNRRMILRGHQYLGHPFSITVFEDFLYWSDWPSESIRRYNKFQKGEVETVAQGLDTPMDIHIYHPYRQEAYSNLCGDNNGGCEHFCLPDPDPDTRYTCVCMTGYMPTQDDATKCIEGEVAPRPTRPTLPSNSTTLSPSESNKNRPGVPPPTTTPPATPKPTTPKPTTPVNSSTSQTNRPSSTPKAPVFTTVPPAVVSTENATEGVPQEQEETTGHIAIIVIVIVLVLLTLVGFIILFVYRHHRSKNIKSMNFDNPVYRKTTTADDDKVVMEVSDSRQNLPSSLQPLNPDHEVV
ncbi:hypothetical protein ACOMHN_043978 [Nucella lapillus]